MKKLNLEKINWLPPLLARIAVGLVFIEAGWGKIHNIPRVTDFFRSLNIIAPEFQAYNVAYSEFIFGLLLLVGLFSRLVSLPLIIIMIVALATAKAADITGLTDLFGLSEFLYILLLIWIVVSGPGKLSFDFLWQKFRRPSS